MTMPQSLNPKDPTPVIVAGLAGYGDGTGTFRGHFRESVPVSTSTGTNVTRWVNNTGRMCAVTCYVVIETAGTGTGTFDCGLSQDGTGSADDIINGGTLDTVRVITPGTVSSTAVTGNTAQWFVCPGSGTNNSIVLSHTDAAGTGTLGAILVVEGFPLT